MVSTTSQQHLLTKVGNGNKTKNGILALKARIREGWFVPTSCIFLETIWANYNAGDCILVFKGLRVSHNSGWSPLQWLPQKNEPFLFYSFNNSVLATEPQLWRAPVGIQALIHEHHHSSQSSGAHSHFHEAIQQERCCRVFESSHKLLPSFTSLPPKALVLCCEGKQDVAASWCSFGDSDAGFIFSGETDKGGTSYYPTLKLN